MQTFEVGRNLSYDYLLLVTLVAVIFNLFLIQERKWKELAVFNIAGLINLVMEISMIGSGMRNFDTQNLFFKTIAAICLAWVTNGFLFAVAYINVRQWMKRTYEWRFVIAANLIFFVGLPLATVNYGMLNGSVHTWRQMKEIIVYAEVGAFFVLAAIIWFMGYKKLLWRLLVMGLIIDLSFESRLFLLGVRPMAQFQWGRVLPRVLFEMNAALMLGFVILKAIFGARDYKDRPAG